MRFVVPFMLVIVVAVAVLLKLLAGNFSFVDTPVQTSGADEEEKKRIRKEKCVRHLYFDSIFFVIFPIN